MRTSTPAAGDSAVTAAARRASEASIRAWGERILSSMEAADPPSFFSSKGLYRGLMDWVMKDDRFKVQLFRFVDVLPALSSPTEVARHLREYLETAPGALPVPWRAALKASRFAGRLVGSGVTAQVERMARMFMLGNNPREVVRALKQFYQDGAGYTLDLLGEAVVSDAEADRYAARYLELLNLLGEEMTRWPGPCRSDVGPEGAVPGLNLSLKVSAFSPHLRPEDTNGALERLGRRLRPVLRRARELPAFVTFDMESYALKALTLRLFKELFSEAEFADGPACGLAIQAYLRESARDLEDLVDWARCHGRRLTVRLVKGAYWDYETVHAARRGWPVPVYARKAETDASFERLSRLLLEAGPGITPAFGSHNVRSLAAVLAEIEHRGMDPRRVEFQVLYGMADALTVALLHLGCRVRVYCPVGELLPGMAYLVRRLLENTSNEGFLANQYGRGVSRDDLLRSPEDELAREEPDRVARAGRPSPAKAGSAGSIEFANEPPTDFNREDTRVRWRTAIDECRRGLGRRCPLVINHRRVETADWTPSLNPARQSEVIGYAARASVREAEAALQAARGAQPSWRRTPVADRGALLNRVADLMGRDRAQLGALMILEAGKNWEEADADVAEAIDFCRFYAAVMPSLGVTSPTQPVPGESNVQHWWPRGTGVVLAPWNFPLSILTGMTMAAVVGGNAVVMKPSDLTPVIGARLMALLEEAGLPAGVVNLVTGSGAEVGAYLASHAQTDFIAFTGSREVGLSLWATAGRTVAGQDHLKKVICEMGGKNAVIVDGDADLDEAVLGALDSAFGYQGQKCSALSRLILLRDSAPRFLDRFLAAAAALPVGPAESPGTIIGPVINRSAQQRILRFIEASRSEATLVWQGAVPDEDAACYVPPTVFTEVRPESRLFREEVFGPVLAVTVARDFGEALGLANDCDYALTGGLYSRSPEHIAQARQEMVCGNLYINRPITGALVGRQPFGGFRMSGGGTKAGGPEYLQQFLVPRVITEDCVRRGFAPEEEDPVPSGL